MPDGSPKTVDLMKLSRRKEDCSRADFILHFLTATCKSPVEVYSIMGSMGVAQRWCRVVLGLSPVIGARWKMRGDTT
ncbi:hypothetical protein IH799_08165, partial [candidate division KSB1 bacterium]|nr:hypothetical protein [candidate division KSB1 bacterium]